MIYISVKVLKVVMESLLFISHSNRHSTIIFVFNELILLWELIL